MRKAIEWILAALGCAIVAMVVGLVLAGISQSGVLNLQITRVLFIIAFAVSIIAAPLAAWLISQSKKQVIAALILALVVVGGGLWWLYGWLLEQKVAQDAASHPPPVLHTSAPPPTVPIVKPKKPKPPQPQVKIEQHGAGSGTVGGNLTVGPGGIALVGGAGNTATVNNYGPPQRHWSKEAKEEIADCVKATPAEFSLVITAGATEQQTFAQDWQEMFNLAKWHVDDPSYPIKSGMPNIVWYGVHVKVHNDASADNRPALTPNSPEMALFNCLKDRGDLPDKVDFVPMQTIPTGQVHVEIGAVKQPSPP
jgi:hypothetical protein